ncbi:AP-2 complex subunit alpha [Sarotherodon galilaeus]
MPEHPGIPQPHRESISKHVWIKLTGPAAGCLSEAFCQSVAGLQENVSAKVVTPREAQRDDVTVPPTVIVMEGKAAGAQKYIKVEKLYRIVLLGDTEAGKSSLANIIFGENVFQVNNTECQTESKSLHGRRITLINTPDFSGPGRSEEQLKPEILRCITEWTPGPHAFVIVLKVEKSTEQQQQAVIEKISQYFSEEVFKYAAVVFIQDGPDSDEMKIKQFIDQNKYLRDLVKKCKSRYHIINKYNGQGGSSQFKVVDLLNTVDRLVNENKGVCYTSKMLPQADTHYKANSSVSKNEMIKLAGTAAESMAKAFSGSAVVVLTPGSTNAIEKDGTETDKKEENGDGKATSETNNNGHKEMTNEEEGGGGGRKNQQTKVTKEDNRQITKGEEERKSEGEVANETKEAQEGKTTGQSNELEQDEGPNETQEDREEEAGETVQEETQEKIEGKVEDKPQKTVQEHATEKEPLGGGASAGGGAAAGGGVAAGVLLTAASGIAGGVLSAAASGIGGGALSAGASGIAGGALSAAVESVAGATGAAASAGTAGMGGAAEAVKAAGAGANAGTAGGGGAAEAVEAAGAGANAGTVGGGGAAEAVEAAGAGANAGTAGARGAAASGITATGYVAASAVATGGAVGVAWLIQKIRNVIELIKQHVGLVLLVLVFYSLLLSWFFLKAPFAGTLLLSFLFLLLVIILVII